MLILIIKVGMLSCQVTQHAAAWPDMLAMTTCLPCIPMLTSKSLHTDPKQAHFTQGKVCNAKNLSINVHLISCSFLQSCINKRLPPRAISLSVGLVVGGCIIAGAGDFAFDLKGYVLPQIWPSLLKSYGIKNELNYLSALLGE